MAGKNSDPRVAKFLFPTQEGLARAVGVSAATVRRVLRGDRIPTAALADSIAAYVGLPPEVLFPERRAPGQRTYRPRTCRCGRTIKATGPRGPLRCPACRDARGAA